MTPAQLHHVSSAHGSTVFAVVCNLLMQDVVQQLQQLFPDVQPYVHPVVSSAVIVPGKGPLQPDYQQCGALMPLQHTSRLWRVTYGIPYMQ
jgi:hypothetical protein